MDGVLIAPEQQASSPILQAMWPLAQMDARAMSANPAPTIMIPAGEITPAISPPAPIPPAVEVTDITLTPRVAVGIHRITAVAQGPLTPLAGAEVVQVASLVVVVVVAVVVDAPEAETNS